MRLVTTLAILASLSGVISAAEEAGGDKPHGPSPEQREAMAKKLLAKFDTNNDGGVDKAEFAAGLKAMAEERAKNHPGAEGKEPDAEKADELKARAEKRFAEADANGDGKLDGEELAKGIGRGGKRGEHGEKGEKGEKGEDAPAKDAPAK